MREASERRTVTDTDSIPNSVTSVGYGAFGNCTSLRSVTIPNSVKRISDLAFYNCQKLENVVMPKTFKSDRASIFAHTPYGEEFAKLKEKEEKEAERQKMASLVAKYGKKNVDKIMNKEVTSGMPWSLVKQFCVYEIRHDWGATKNYQIWLYNQKTGYYYKSDYMFVTVRNGVITSVTD